ncbi:MAG: hypothetical protein EA376_05835 [Phycisphaeraceae bacterium]|nr:MAG: hypothetical protein EA376_05835 [Phycisphaeraceae bacterium]
MNIIGGLLLSILAVVVAVMAVIYIIVPVFRAIGWIIRQVYNFITGVIGDLLRIIGSVVTLLFFIPLVVLNVIIGRWSAAAHFGAAIQQEVVSVGRCFYRVLIGHPARLFGLTALTEGLEKRLPEAMAKAPTSDKPSKRTGVFEGYQIVGSLRGGGSGAKIYIAEPDATKRAIFARSGVTDVDQVVIKSFSLRDGSSLPQIIRESRALEAAKEIGLVLEHSMDEHRFHYVMPYVPGDSLGVVTHRLHDASGSEGLNDKALREGVGYVADLVRTLDRYHRGGLWHKDVKPDNIIVSGGQAHLVDLGLVTPLRSAMTLTTHGTEYFRDPELVRMALKGVKVHEVDGGRFDVYAAGAVLYAVIENSFPAHGGLSQVSKRCPEALRWIIRRAMTDYDRRYATAAELLEDMNFVLAATDPFSIKPKDLPSMAGGAAEVADPEPEADPFDDFAPTPRPAPAAAGSPRPPREEGEGFEVAGVGVGVGSRGPFARAGRFSVDEHGDPVTPAGAATRGRRAPRLLVTDWWTGRYTTDAPPAPAPAPRAAARPHRPAGKRAPAQEQLRSARARMEAARERAQVRMSRHNERYSNKPNVGVAIALFVFLGMCVLVAGAVVMKGLNEPSGAVAAGEGDNAESVGHSERIDIRVGNLRESLDDVSRRVAQKLASAGVQFGDLGVQWEELAQTSEGAVPSPTGRWLVLNDVRDRADEETMARIAFGAQMLESFGFDLVGIGEDPEDIELSAMARKTIGQGRPDSAETTGRITTWLESREGDLGGLIWLFWSLDGESVAYEALSTSQEQRELAGRLLGVVLQ